jgi:uncharacterized protein (DUF885 family)
MVRVLRLSRRKLTVAIALLTFVFSIATHSFLESIASAKPSNWIARSNENANLLIKAESGSECTDQPKAIELLATLNPKFQQCYRQSIANVIKTLEAKTQKETDPSVKLDLEILIQAANQELQSEELDQKYRLPYINLGRAILDSLADLDNQSVLRQLNRYAGVEPGSTAIAVLATQQIRDRIQQTNLYFPDQAQVKEDLANTNVYLERIKTLLERKKARNYQAAYTSLRTQLSDYATVVQQTVLPNSRTDFRLPQALYNAELAERGVEIPVDQLIAQAHAAFQDVQRRMDILAPQIARQKRFQANGYRDVIRELKQAQLPRNQVVPHYEQRQKQLEAIIQREKLVTLPKRSLKIRLTTDRENATFPVPQYQRPESSSKMAGTFIIPVLKTLPKNSAPYDDFTYPAVSWTLTAHEGRPGHDLQFTTVQDKGISEARSRFGVNAANHEGWALYAEAITLPYMPIEGQFISLQFQLLRSARAFLEPELHLGKITTDEALRVLTEDAGYSKFFAQQEIQRYTTKIPGQAPSYFYGFERLAQLRSEVEQKLGQKFNQQHFHDFILEQGFMPQRMLRKAVIEQFLKMEMDRKLG